MISQLEYPRAGAGSAVPGSCRGCVSAHSEQSARQDAGRLLSPPGVGVLSLQEARAAAGPA